MTLQLLNQNPAQTLDRGIYRLEPHPNGYTLEVFKRRDGSRNRNPLVLPLTIQPDRANLPLIDYIVTSLASKTPRLLRLMVNSRSVLKVAAYFYNYKTGSSTTLQSYLWRLSRYCTWMEKTPDELIEELQVKRNSERLKALEIRQERVETFLMELKSSGVAPATVQAFWKSIKTFHTANGISLNLPHPLPRQVRYHDRAPTPEELSKVLDIAGIREKLIVSALALGGFREHTLVRLQYRHVRSDLETGRVPIHVHIETEITKGKYGDYDTFLGAEAAEYLPLYLEARKQGTLRIPPETLTDDSPLIRALTHDLRPIREDQIFQLVHELLRRTGVLGPKQGSRYQLRVHSLRKYFRTQLSALGVPNDYAEYMMGHKISTYHDIQMKGPEFLRGIYASSGLSIRPKTKFGKVEMLKEVVRGMGMDPEKILVKEALIEPNRTVMEPDTQIHLLSHGLREFLLKEMSSRHHE